MPEPTAAPVAVERRGSRLRNGVGVAVVVLAAVGIAELALHRLRGYRYPHDVGAALAGVKTVIATTGRVAVIVWLVGGLTVWVVARWLRRVSDLGVAEAVAAAVVLLWGGAYVTLLLLGPFHLYQPAVLRLLVGLVLVLAWWGSAGKVPVAPRRPGGWGPWVAFGAFALVAGPLLLMQLGSPVSPFMDVLPYVASTEKIVTFRFYDPLANDAAGLWPPSRQVPGCDGILSLLALVAGAPARVAITSLIVPVAAFNLLAMYLMGRNVKGGLAGGFACLFLLQTFHWRRSADVRSTALAIPLTVIGLVFLLGSKRGGVRAALGGFTLGLAVAVNPLIGTFGMQVASVGTIVEWLDFRRGFVVRVLALVGGVLLTMPGVLIGSTIRSPLWALALPALAGCALLLLIARSERGFRRALGPPLPWARLACIVGAPLLTLYMHSTREVELFPEDWNSYPILSLLALCGSGVVAAAVWRKPARWPAAAVPALALLIGILDFQLISPWRFQGTLQIKALASASTPKIVLYWDPYWMALLAGAFFARAARRTALIPVLVAVLVLVIYPIRAVPEPLDFDGAELSVAGTWGFHLTHAARGYWAGRGDRRWVLDDNYQAVADALTAEIRTGKIDYYTHVMVIAPDVEAVELALATGISADVVSPQFDPNGYWNLDSRVRNLKDVGQAFAERPPFVIIVHYPSVQFPQLAADYEEMVARQYVRLYRRVNRTEG